MTTQAYLAHCAPGRVRLKIPSRKGDSGFFNDLWKKGEGLPGVSRAEANPLTGSLLLIMDAGADLSPLQAARSLDLALEDRQRLTLERKAGREMGALNQKVRDYTGGELDLKSIVFLGCIAAGVYQIVTGNFTLPAWFVAFWYAMNLSVGESS